jgi:hypothetical protein
MVYLEPAPVRPNLVQYPPPKFLHRPVVGVVNDDDLVVRVVEVSTRGEKPVHHSFLVE